MELELWSKINEKRSANAKFLSLMEEVLNSGDDSLFSVEDMAKIGRYLRRFGLIFAICSGVNLERKPKKRAEMHTFAPKTPIKELVCRIDSHHDCRKQVSAYLDCGEKMPLTLLTVAEPPRIRGHQATFLLLDELHDSLLK